MRLWRSLCTLTLLSLGACAPEPGDGMDEALETNTAETLPHADEGAVGQHAADSDESAPGEGVRTALAGVVAGPGTYWNFDNNTYAPWPGNGGDLTSVPRYATGPCAGRTPGTCRFDTRVIVSVYGQLLESITAYGRYWNFDMNNNYAPLPGNGSDLLSVPHYASGPCAGRAPGTCRFDSRLMEVIDGKLVESITAYGRYWNFDVYNNNAPWSGNGSDLTSVPRYANGPCAGRAAGTCTFDTRVVALVKGQLLESITAYGRYWNFDMNNNYAPLPGNGSDLTSVPRYASGPCAGRAPGTCRFATRSIEDIGDGQFESIILSAP